MQWLKTENEDLYDPDYNDLIRVAFTTQFNTGVMSIAPNSTVFSDLLDVMMHPDDKYDPNGTEQACLNYYFNHRATILGIIYNMNLALWRSLANDDLRKTWDKFRPDGRMIIWVSYF